MPSSWPGVSPSSSLLSSSSSLLSSSSSSLLLSSSSLLLLSSLPLLLLSSSSLSFEMPPPPWVDLEAAAPRYLAAGWFFLGVGATWVSLSFSEFENCDRIAFAACEDQETYETELHIPSQLS